MNNKILFVWDFHGVLEKGNVFAVEEACNLTLKESGFDRRISTQEAINWYGLSWFDYFRLALPQGNEELWHNMVDKLFSTPKRDLEIIKKHIKPRDFAEEVLKEIRRKGHENILITNSRTDHARIFTDVVGLTKHIDKIIGVDTHHKPRLGSDIYNIKAETLTNFLKDKNYNKIIVIGDRESDIKAGKSCDATTYLFFDPDINKKPTNTEADYVISDLREVLKELK